MQQTRSLRNRAAIVLLTAAAALVGSRVGAAKPLPVSSHVESRSGGVLSSDGGDDPVNPASVIKLATTHWALTALGPEHRFETRFGYTGSLAEGRVGGDLVVRGGADPDFHVENAYLVARALNAAGVREIAGRLRVSETFWIGWEGGSERRIDDPVARATLMAERLRDALDPARWSDAERRGIDEMRERKGLSDEPYPSVLIRGELGGLGDDPTEEEVVVHFSNPLPLTLKRFNVYSNNDIERFGETLGSAAELERRLQQRWGASRSVVQVATLSGLGANRITPRLAVRLLRDLARAAQDAGLQLEQLLPVAGCDPGTLDNFPGLGRGPAKQALVAKTGSLNDTDGGVATMAGRVASAKGMRWFFIVTPNAGGRLGQARIEQTAWISGLIDEAGGSKPGDCPRPLAMSFDEAIVVDAALAP